MCAYTYRDLYICTYLHMYIHIFIHIYIYACVFVFACPTRCQRRPCQTLQSQLQQVFRFLASCLDTPHRLPFAFLCAAPPSVRIVRAYLSFEIRETIDLLPNTTVPVLIVTSILPIFAIVATTNLTWCVICRIATSYCAHANHVLSQHRSLTGNT